jgi:hopene-associated glycosyltransferase HpnB
MTVLTAAGAVAAAAWIAVALHPARPWDLRPRDGDGPPQPEPTHWPALVALVPARNEAETLPRTLPALLAQDYPGEWRVVVVDDRSSDGTGEVVRAIARSHPQGHRAELVAGRPLPDGWVGKVWALEQAARRAVELLPATGVLLLTDADILHSPCSARRLVAESVSAGLALTSRMARLRCCSRAERLLIPPFLLFFNLLYPMRWANRPGRKLAAAAGGCILLRRDALQAIGGFGSIRGAIIDDLALARRVKGVFGGGTRLALSDGTVRSIRAYGALPAVWRMVRRSAFAQLRRSWTLLAATLVLLALVFLAPPVAVAVGLGAAAAGAGSGAWAPPLLAGLAAWLTMAGVALPATRFFGLSPAWGLALPLAGSLYGAMTLDSALQDAPGRRRDWR